MGVPYIVAKFQPIHRYFRGLGIQLRFFRYSVLFTHKPENQDDGSITGNTLDSVYLFIYLFKMAAYKQIFIGYSHILEF